VEGLAGSASAGLTLSYGYLSDGTKTSALVEDTGNPNDEAEGLKYRGSFVYEVSGSTERLGSVAWDEGRIAIDYSQNAANPYIRDEWHVRDHLGNTRMVVNLTDYGTVIEKNEYMPFGTRLPSTNELTSNRYRLGGKEEQRFGTGASSLDLRLSDFGARYYDPFTCRWTTCDPLAGKYPEWGPYNYCAGNPVNVVDPFGKDIYMLFYSTGNTRGDEMFKASAETRKRDIENSNSFDPNTDVVILAHFQDMATVPSMVSSIVKSYSSVFGKTKEFSIWSHGGKDGPVGSIATSKFSLDTKQMSLEGWSIIDFNWGENAIANFFGCNTGKGSPSFTTRISNLDNFENVTINGQQSYSYPSIYTDTRTNNLSVIKGVFSYPTYMVGGGHRGIISHFFPTSAPAVPMSSSLNGIEMKKTYYQTGRKH